MRTYVGRHVWIMLSPSDILHDYRDAERVAGVSIVLSEEKARTLAAQLNYDLSGVHLLSEEEVKDVLAPEDE